MDTQLILHPTDGSESAAKALDYAIDLALRAGSKLLVLHVQRQHGRDRIPAGLEAFERAEKLYMAEAEVVHAAAEAIASRAERVARGKGVGNTETLVIEGDPAAAIVEVAKARNVGTIVMGSRGLGGLKGLLLGSVSHKVAQLAPCTCIIVR